MIVQNILIGCDVDINDSASINNVSIGDNVKIAKLCSVFGGSDNLISIGDNTYIGMSSTLNGFSAKLKIGKNCSIAQNVCIMTDSGPNASLLLQKIFPIVSGAVSVGDHCWIGAGTIVMPNVVLGDFCVVGANSFVTESFEEYSIVAGNPARLIRKLTSEEVDELLG